MIKETTLSRTACALAGLMGAIGVALAAAAAHLPDATRLGAASSMLLFHAAAVIGTVLLTAQRLARPGIGLIAAFGFIVGGALFAGDLSLRQAEGHGLFTMAAPTGGTLLILSWLVLALAVIAPRRAENL